MLKPIKRHTVIDPRWWFVCVVKSNMEMSFRRELAKSGVLNFAPSKVIVMNLFGKRIPRRVPLFPNYVFVYGSHYREFRKKDDWKGLLYCINEEKEKIYKMPHRIIYELITKQALGEFDITNNSPVAFTIGDVVDVVAEADPEPPLYEKSEYFLTRDATIISMSSKRATIISGNKVWKIKLCYLRKSVHKSRPLGSGV